ncbi:MAG: UDP-2,3-diacylglucosamine diphosphatase [Gammaproteobacteria bacterium]
MSITLFIADLHLDPVRPEISDLFLEFLAGEAREADALYILGDLFEAWIGDDNPDPHHARIADGLRELADAGTAVYFLIGNRDFLLGEDYARRAGMTILDEPVTLDLHGTPTVILHGDVLCTDDLAYQAFRAMVHNPRWQRHFLSLPLEERRILAGQARRQSRAPGRSLWKRFRMVAGRPQLYLPLFQFTARLAWRHLARFFGRLGDARPGSRTASTDILDVNDAAVAALFRELDVPRMIHGHTHRPAAHKLDVDGRPRERIVLGDWYEQGSVLRITEAGANLVALPLG